MQPFVSGGVWNCQENDRVAESQESRREAPSGEGSWEGVPLPRIWGSRGVIPRKFLKFGTQFGAIWC